MTPKAQAKHYEFNKWFSCSALQWSKVKILSWKRDHNNLAMLVYSAVLEVIEPQSPTYYSRLLHPNTRTKATIWVVISTSLLTYTTS